MPDVSNVHEKYFASTLLIAIAGASSANIDRFSGWVLAGYAAATTFLLVHSHTLPSIFSVDPMPRVLWTLVAVLTLSIAQKLLAVAISGAAAAAPIGRLLVGEFASRGIELDIPAVLREMERAMIPPMRWFVIRSFKKAESGDIVASARNFSRFAQIQAIIVFVQVLLVVIQIWSVASGLAL